MLVDELICSKGRRRCRIICALNTVLYKPVFELLNNYDQNKMALGSRGWVVNVIGSG